MSKLNDTITEALARYGYGLKHPAVITKPNGDETGAYITVKLPRAQVRRADGKILWSGAPSALGDFLERYWYARPLTACRCWTYDAALGHEGHCCFLEDDRSKKWRHEDEICHVPTVAEVTA